MPGIELRELEIGEQNRARRGLMKSSTSTWTLPTVATRHKMDIVTVHMKMMKSFGDVYRQNVQQSR